MDSVHIVFYLFIHMFIGVMVSGVSVQEANFHLSTDPLVGWLPLKPAASLVNFTRISCAVKCGKKAGQCYSFTYNKDSGICTLGAKVSRKRPAVTANQGQLYIKDVCEATENFVLWEDNQVRMCVFVNMSGQVTFGIAEKACTDLDMDGHLVAPKSTAEFDLLKSKLLNVDADFWMGMDDRDTEGQWLYTYDNTAVNASLMTYMFEAGNPNNQDYQTPNADCARYVEENDVLFDSVCLKWNISYVCEKKVVTREMSSRDCGTYT